MNTSSINLKTSAIMILIRQSGHSFPQPRKNGIIIKLAFTAYIHHALTKSNFPKNKADLSLSSLFFSKE